MLTPTPPAAAERVARSLHVLSTLAHGEAHEAARVVLGERRGVERAHRRRHDALGVRQRLAELDVGPSVGLGDQEVSALRLAVASKQASKYKYVLLAQTRTCIGCEGPNVAARCTCSVRGGAAREAR